MTDQAYGHEAECGGEDCSLCAQMTEDLGEPVEEDRRWILSPVHVVFRLGNHSEIRFGWLGYYSPRDGRPNFAVVVEDLEYEDQVCGHGANRIGGGERYYREAFEPDGAVIVPLPIMEGGQYTIPQVVLEAKKDGWLIGCTGLCRGTLINLFPVCSASFLQRQAGGE